MACPADHQQGLANGTLEEAAVANQASEQVPVPGDDGDDQDSVALNATTIITSSSMTDAEPAAAVAVASSATPPPPVTTQSIGPTAAAAITRQDMEAAITLAIGAQREQQEERLIDKILNAMQDMGITRQQPPHPANTPEPAFEPPNTPTANSWESDDWHKVESEHWRRRTRENWEENNWQENHNDQWNTNSYDQNWEQTDWDDQGWSSNKWENLIGKLIMMRKTDHIFHILISQALQAIRKTLPTTGTQS